MRESSSDEQPGWGEALRASTLGWELALPIFGGALLGHFLDQRAGVGYTFTVGLLFVGVIAGFYNIWRYGQRQDAISRKRRKMADVPPEERDP